MALTRELIPVSQDWMFSCKTDTDLWPVWHYHPEIDILLFLKNTGNHVTGDFIGTFEPGSVFYNSPNVPHGFTANESDEGNPDNPATIAIQFSESTVGADLLNKSEMSHIRRFLQHTTLSCEFLGSTREQAATLIQNMTMEQGAHRLVSFIALLELFATAPETDRRSLVSPHYRPVLNEKNITRIEVVRQWILSTPGEDISLGGAAAQVNMTPKSFSYFFKKNTGRSFVQYVTQLRISRACQLLVTSHQHIIEICYNSGFNNVSNFNRRFKDLKGMTPKEYRKQYSTLTMADKEPS